MSPMLAQSVVALLLALAGPARGVAAGAVPPESLLVEVRGRVTVLRRADLAGMARDSVRATFRGVGHTYAGVRLTDVLRRAGVAVDSAHGTNLVSRVLVEASDGWRVIFSLPELLPAFAGRRVLVADLMDGAALPGNEGPWRLLCPDDGEEHARWVRGVVAIRVRAE